MLLSSQEGVASIENKHDVLKVPSGSGRQTLNQSSFGSRLLYEVGTTPLTFGYQAWSHAMA